MKKMKYILFSALMLFLSSYTVYARPVAVTEDNPNVTTSVVSSGDNLCATFGDDALPIPIGIPNFISKLITLAQILVPVIIIIVAMVRYMKAMTSGDDKVIKETNSSFIRSLITGVAIFLLVVIVKFVFSLAGDDATSSLKYVSCFINGEDECVVSVCPERTNGENQQTESGTNQQTNNETNQQANSENNEKVDDGRSTVHDSSSGTQLGGNSRSQ